MAAPTTLAEAVKLAADRCQHLEFLPEATRSAEAWQYQRPEVVLNALVMLDALARSWRDGALTGSFTVAARRPGCRGGLPSRGRPRRRTETTTCAGSAIKR